jgi:hypothetical protein
MSDGVLAALIAASATVFGSFIQLRTSVAKEIATRTRSSPSRRANHVVLIMLVVMLLGAAVGGFALAQWVFENERATQQALVRDLRDRIGDFTRYQSEIEQSRSELRSVVRTDVMRRMGADGVVVLATVAACRPPAAMSRAAMSTAGGPSGPPAVMKPSPSGTYIAPSAVAAKPSASAGAQSPTASPGAACSESDATPIVLCATIPAAAQLGNVELYVRQTDATGRWSDSRLAPGVASAMARFAAKPVEIADGGMLKQECIGFSQWSDQPRIARMVVHYSF